jgi:hypothetical protein
MMTFIELTNRNPARKSEKVTVATEHIVLFYPQTQGTGITLSTGIGPFDVEESYTEVRELIGLDNKKEA